MTPTRTLLLCLLLAAPLSGEGVVEPLAASPINGFPNWEERVMQQWINRARAEPSVDLADCGANCTDDEMEPTCYTPQAPLRWDYELSVAARFHSQSMSRQSFFGHSTPCTLRTDLGDVYPGSCDGSAACSCSGSGSTSPPSRASRFDASYSGEIIAAGYSNPDAAFYGWLHEPVQASAPCAYSSYGQGNTNGHRWLILKSTSGALGSGYATGGSWNRYYTTDFGGGGTVSKLPSGAHYPRQSSNIDFWASWYDSEGPSQARVIVGSTAHTMTLDRGTQTNGAWTTTVTGLGSGCHRYYFQFLDSDGQPHRQPATGTFGIGDAATCADWADSVAEPPTLNAIATSSSAISVSWSSSPGVSQYQLERSVGDVPFAPIITLAGLGWTDTTVSANTTYVYRVRPLASPTVSNIDHATTIQFTDEPLVAGTVAKAVHLTQLRTAVNAMREAAGLADASWTNASPSGVEVRAAHILELRTALAPALTALDKSSSFPGTIAAGNELRASHLQDLRNAVQ